jgi:acyl carrier protein
MTEIKHAVLIVMAFALTADNVHVTGGTSCAANLTTTPADPGGEKTVTLNHKTRTAEPMSDVAERVRKIVVEHFASVSRYIDECKVTENARFIDLGANEVDTVALTMAFEQEFGCEIPDDAWERFVTVKDAVSFIESHC